MEPTWEDPTLWSRLQCDVLPLSPALIQEEQLTGVRESLVT